MRLGKRTSPGYALPSGAGSADPELADGGEDERSGHGICARLGRKAGCFSPAVPHAGLPAPAQREKTSIFSWGQAPAQGMVPACSWPRMASACWLTSS
jgi:hypothetical protein